MIIINPYRFAVAPSTLLTGLTASYSLDGNATKNVGTNNGTATNVTYTTGKFGQCAFFNGTGSIKIADSSDWNFAASDFAISLWLKRGTIGSRQIFCGQIGSSGTNNTVNVFVEFQSNDTIRAVFASGTTLYTTLASTNTIAETTTWHNVIIQRNGTNFYIIVDGTQWATSSLGAITLNDSTASFSLGAPGDLAAFYFNGYVDEANIWNGRYLTSTEITELQTKYYPFT